MGTQAKYREKLREIIKTNTVQGLTLQQIYGNDRQRELATTYLNNSTSPSLNTVEDHSTSESESNSDTSDENYVLKKNDNFPTTPVHWSENLNKFEIESLLTKFSLPINQSFEVNKTVLFVYLSDYPDLSDSLATLYKNIYAKRDIPNEIEVIEKSTNDILQKHIPQKRLDAIRKSIDNLKLVNRQPSPSPRPHNDIDNRRPHLIPEKRSLIDDKNPSETHDLPKMSKRKFTVKPDRFSGKSTENVHTFFEKFSLCATFNGWDDNAKLIYLPMYLEENALKIYLHIKDTNQDITWDMIKNNLIKQFSKSSTSLETKLESRVQKKGEDLNAYITDIINTCREIDPKTSEKKICRYIIRGLEPENIDAISLLNNKTLSQLRENFDMLEQRNHLKKHRMGVDLQEKLTELEKSINELKTEGPKKEAVHVITQSSTNERNQYHNAPRFNIAYNAPRFNNAYNAPTYNGRGRYSNSYRGYSYGNSCRGNYQPRGYFAQNQYYRYPFQPNRYFQPNYWNTNYNSSTQYIPPFPKNSYSSYQQNSRGMQNNSYQNQTRER